jgi:hypothetical protein
MVALLAWFILLSGVYSIATGSIGIGLIEIVVALAIVGSVAAGRLPGRSQDRPVPLLVVVMFGVVVVLVAVFQVGELLRAEVMQLGKVYIPDLVNAISAAGYLILTAVFIWQLAVSIRTRSPE